MGLNETPRADRIHIAVFGNTNAGKSSLINAVTNQDLSIVSSSKGTTTDPVYKAMELLPLGPVVFIDTPGLDDEGELGGLRVKKAESVLNKVDLAIVVADITKDEDEAAVQKLVEKIGKRGIQYLTVYNKTDLLSEEELRNKRDRLGGSSVFFVSSVTGEGIRELKEKAAGMTFLGEEKYPIIKDLVSPGDTVILVVPVDKAAPKGRLILPQQQTIRELLDAGAMAYVTRETELRGTLKSLSSAPKMVVTDSQAFTRVSLDTPKDILLTSFSILFARHKGELEILAKSVKAVSGLKDGDRVLISEGCTHHRQCGDIGTVKIPRWLKEHTGKEISFDTTSGTGFPDDLSPYSMIIHCGGCMLNEKEMKYRIQKACDFKIPIVNYGIFIAYVTGILERSLEVFPEIRKIIV